MDFGINNFFDIKHKSSKIGHYQDLEHIDGLSISTISCGLYEKKEMILFFSILEKEQIMPMYIHNLN